MVIDSIQFCPYHALMYGYTIAAQELPGIRSMQFWWSRLQHSHGPLYPAIADVIRAAIDAGELHDGDGLPPQRQLAVALEVNLTTITAMRLRDGVRDEIARRTRSLAMSCRPVVSWRIWRDRMSG